MTTPEATPGLWPPPGDGPLPDPLLSCLHAVVLGDLRPWTLRRWPHDTDTSGLFQGWAPQLGQLLIRSARENRRPDNAFGAHVEWLRREVAASRLADPAGRLADQDPAFLLAELILSTQEVRDRSTDGTDDDWLARWAAGQPVPEDSPGPVTRTDLFSLRLAMGELDAIREVLDASPGGRLRRFTPRPPGHGAGSSEDHGLDLDLHRLQTAYPVFDPIALARRTESALWKRHLFGVLDRSGIEALGLVPADHPCGIDVSASGSKDSLETGGAALTGHDVHDALVLEWGRHEFFDFGEDEDDLFWERDRAALEAALADPWCIKTHEIETVIEYKL